MVKKNNKSELLTLDILPEQDKKSKFISKKFIEKEIIDKKIKEAKINTEPINKQIKNSFWKDYF
tara:strand:+ start:668 stop:859 length:192 start_codon:yes stop_codon:yes gene_type:complete